MKRPKQKTLEQLEAQCIVWNARHPIGTKVKYHPVIGEPAFDEYVTRTEASVLSAHTAVVWLVGKFGCVALDACEALPSGDQSSAGAPQGAPEDGRPE